MEGLLDAARTAAPTYPEVGATRGEALPPGYRQDSYERHLGRGEDVFDRAAAALRGWGAQIGAGARVFPEEARVSEEETVVLLIRVGGLWASLPCRVIYVDEDGGGFAFAYGTLPGHPERGEEAFRIERRADGNIVLRIVAFSRPVDPLARLAAPVTRVIQRRVTKRYLDAIAAAS